MSVDEIKTKILPILRKHGVTRAAVFGSFARNLASGASDIDLLVELRPDAGLLELVDLKIELEETLQRPVDLVEYEALNPALRERVMSEQVVLM